MDIYKEISELKAAWSDRSLLGKTILALAFTLSIMSVGSLADTVFSFKGFIVSGVEFYSELTGPLRQYLSRLTSIEISQFGQDIFILWGLWVGSIWRFDADDPQRKGLPWFLGVIGFCFVGTGLMKFVSFLSNKYVAIMVVYPVAPLLYGVMCNVSFRISAKNKIETFFMSGVYFFVACVAAISEGLARPI